MAAGALVDAAVQWLGQAELNGWSEVDGFLKEWPHRYLGVYLGVLH